MIVEHAVDRREGHWTAGLGFLWMLLCFQVFAKCRSLFVTTLKSIDLRWGKTEITWLLYDPLLSIGLPCKVIVCKCGSVPNMSTSERAQMLLPWRYNTRSSFSRHKTASICMILLKDRSSQASCDGSAKKVSIVVHRSWRSVMLLLLRRREQLRYFFSAFFFRGRRPTFGSCDQASIKCSNFLKDKSTGAPCIISSAVESAISEATGWQL